jgi:hypothetical protein
VIRKAATHHGQGGCVSQNSVGVQAQVPRHVLHRTAAMALSWSTAPHMQQLLRLGDGGGLGPVAVLGARPNTHIRQHVRVVTDLRQQEGASRRQV